jgi:hypothetical protein
VKNRTGALLVNKAGETPGFTLRPSTGSKVIVRNASSGKQRTISVDSEGREYDNAIKKLREIGWTEDLYASAMEAKREERVERSLEEEADALKALQEREASDVPVPTAPGMDKVMHELLTEALIAADTLKDRLRSLHGDNCQGGHIRPEAAMDLLTLHSVSFARVCDIADELRRRGMVAKSMT